MIIARSFCLAVVLLLSVSSAAPVPVGFVYFGHPSDFAWNFRHDEGRVSVDNSNSNFESLYLFNVSLDGFEKAVDDLVSKGVKLLIATSPDYQQEAQKCAQKYPEIKFVVCDGTATMSNLAVVKLNIHDIFFLGGIMAAHLSQTKVAGFIAGVERFVTRRAVQAFLLGARQVSPTFRVVYVANGNWSDSRRTKKEVEILKNKYDCDIFTGYDFDLSGAEAAVSQGLFVFSFPSRVPRTLYGDKVFSGVQIDWTAAYAYFINQVVTNTWKENNYYFPESTTATLCPLSNVVNQTVINFTSRWREKLTNGEYCVFNNNSVGSLVWYNESSFDAKGCLNTNLTMLFYFPTSGIQILPPFKDEELYTPVSTQFDSSFSIAVASVVSLFDLVLLVAVVVVFVFRKTMLIVTTNEFFCYAILFGSIIGYSDLFFWLGEPSDRICHARIWFLSIGFCLLFGALAGKTFKMWRVWTHPEIKESQNSNMVLVCFISVLFVLDLVLLAVLTSLNGYYVDKTFHANLSSDEYYLRCTLSDSGVITLSVLLGYKGLVILITIILAYLSRNVTKRFNEMPSVIISIYSILIAVVVVILLYVITQEPDPTKRAIILTCGVFIGITFPLICIFFPKFYKLWREVSESSHSSSKTSMRTSSHSASGATTPTA